MGQSLRSPNFRTIKFTAPSGGLTGGDMYKTEDAIGVILDTVAAAGSAVLIYEAEKILVPKVTGTGKSFAVGDKVFFNASTLNVTPTTGGGLYLIGIATAAAGASATEVEIDLKGAAAITV